MTGEGGRRFGKAFFGRRKGKALRPAQAAHLERLLPALRIDLGSAPPADGAVRPLCRDRRRSSPRNRLRRRRAPSPPCTRGSGHRLHRCRALRQFPGQAAGRPRRRAARKRSPLRRRRRAASRLAAGRLARRRRPALSRSLAEEEALEAPLRLTGKSGSLRACPEAGGNFRFASDIDSYVNWTLLPCRPPSGFRLDGALG